MNFDKPEKVALYIATILSFSVFLIFPLLSMLIDGLQVSWNAAFIAGVLVFAGAFFTTKYAAERFIHKKVRLIYKTIHNLKSRKDTGDKEPTTSDLDFVDREVKAWAEEQSKEIQDLKIRENYRREFIGNISHELKTPIFNIQGYILTLLDGALSDPEINEKFLKRTHKSVERMIRILQDMETISKLEAGEMDLNMKEFNLLELVREVTEMVEMKALEREVKITTNGNGEKAIKVFADVERIEQVLTNLILNSIKYGKKGGETKLRFYDMDENILVEVADNGVGIPEKDLPRLFERFYRVDKSRARDMGGSGLGLAIVKHIVDAHNQTIHVRSTEGIGSTFSFTLKKAK